MNYRWVTQEGQHAVEVKVLPPGEGYQWTSAYSGQGVLVLGLVGVRYAIKGVEWVLRRFGALKGGRDSEKARRPRPSDSSDPGALKSRTARRAASSQAARICTRRARLPSAVQRVDRSQRAKPRVRTIATVPTCQAHIPTHRDSAGSQALKPAWPLARIWLKA